ncbi:MAG: AAA family ATPase, partial [Oscillospiraceae bacterium]|nr:AAA family ATPase [Oscillospiraceae bacterium]
MRIHGIIARNYKGFSELEIDLQGKSTVFFGINGVGKTSLLALINYLFRPWCYRLNPSQGKAFGTLTDELVHFNQSEMAMAVYVEDHQKKYTLSRRYFTSRPGVKARSVPSAEDYAALVSDTSKMVEQNANLPVFVSYGTNRSVLQIPLRIRQKHVFTQFTALERAVENAIDFKTFFEWFRDQEDLENEYIRDHGDNTYRDKSLECVRMAVEAMLDQVSGLRIKRNPPRMVVDKNGEELTVDYLSDGEKCTLALFGDLARRLAIANPHLVNPLEGEGIVLIDEIELHMHPTWQRKVLAVLKRVFPHVQFIVTTHSPQVLGELNNEYLIYHIENTEKDEQILSRLHRMDGFDSNYILENYMDTPSVNIGFQKKVRDTYQLIEEEHFSDAEKAIQEIAEITELNHAEVIRLEGALKRGKYLYE